jgi:hypothetical protein
MNPLFDDEEQHFNIDMIMHDTMMHSSYKKNEQVENEGVKYCGRGLIPMHKRIKTKKYKKHLIMKKRAAAERRKEKRSNQEPKLYECHHPMCEKSFLDRNSYRKHIITHGEKQA